MAAPLGHTLAVQPNTTTTTTIDHPITNPLAQQTSPSLIWCRSLLNDSYRTPLHLVYPPHVVALGCLHLMSVLRRIDLRAWLEGLNTDLNQVGYEFRF